MSKDSNPKTCSSCQRTFHTERDFISKTFGWAQCQNGYLWFNCSCGSTLVLKPGKFSWYSPIDQLSQSGRSLLNRLQGKQEIPLLPSGLFKLQQLIENPNSTTEQIAQNLKRNPLLVVEVINLARNMQHRGKTDISTIEHAVVYVGRKTLKMVALLATIKSYKFNTKLYQPFHFWREALLTGALAETIVEKFAPGLTTEEVFLEGALANVGKAVGAIVVPEEIDQVFEYINAPNTSGNWSTGENALGCISHVSLGEIAAVLWGLPRQYRRSIAEHHNLNYLFLLENRPLSTVDVVAGALQLTHWLLSDSLQISDTVLDRFKQTFQLNSEALEQFVEELKPLRTHVEDLVNEPPRAGLKAG